MSQGHEGWTEERVEMTAPELAGYLHGIPVFFTEKILVLGGTSDGKPEVQAHGLPAVPNVAFVSDKIAKEKDVDPPPEVQADEPHRIKFREFL